MSRMTTNHRPLLSIQDLSVSFRTNEGVNSALRNVSFSLHRGEIIAVVGESGSGKSVTSLSIMGLLSESAVIEKGSILYQPEDLATDLLLLTDEEKLQTRGQEISMIFQEPMTSLNPVLKIGDQLTEALIDHQLCNKKDAYKKATELLSQVHIADVDRVMSSYPDALSGGMRQRVMIALALTCEPKILIADEPTTALDVTIQSRILHILRELQKIRDMSVMFITHDMGVVAEIADKVIVMYRGEVVESGPVKDIFNSPCHPYTKSLLKAVPKLGDMADYYWPKPFELIGKACELSHEEHKTANYNCKPLLDVRGLKVYYPIRSGLLSRITHEVHAVEQIDFKVWPGETLAIVGESGCGKSTTGRSILRLIESESESVHFQGKEISLFNEKSFKPIRREIQMVFQDPYASLNPRLTIGFSIAEPLLIHGLAKNLLEATPVVEDLLTSVGLLPEHAQRYPHEFSGGQRQRIAIARAMALKPKVIIADEAVSALDVSVQAQVINLMMDLQKKTGVTWIFISHDMAVVERIANRVAVMYLGKIVELGDRQSVFNHPQHPYTKRLLESVPIADPNHRKKRDFDDKELPRSPMKSVGIKGNKAIFRKVNSQHWVAE